MMILSDRYLGSTCSNLIYFSFLGVLDTCEQYYTQHTSKFRNFLNKASAMLSNAFKHGFAPSSHPRSEECKVTPSPPHLENMH